jgi:hypothetical protein
MITNKVSFKDLKARVGVDDIAYYLGYRLDHSAGIGKYIEMVLDNGDIHTDKLIIKNPQDKSAQTYFRRNGAKGGDVVNLILENINSFGERGHDTWEIVAKVMARFANEPIPDYRDRKYMETESYNRPSVFDPKRYEVQPGEEHLKHLMSYFTRRGITEETARVFSPFLCRVKDLNMSSYDNYNLGFPYTKPGNTKVLGYEIRGYNGYKSKAAGTNSSSAAWIADLSNHQNPLDICNVYFAESGYDIMAFYQANRLKIEKDSSVFVSLGGTFSDRQITGIMNHYSEARAIDCFDNDLPGRIYGVRMVGLLEGLHLNIIKQGYAVIIKTDDKEFSMPADDVSIAELGKHIDLRYKVGQWKAAPAFKDWNDQVMDKPMGIIQGKSKYQRDEKLSEDRKSCFKL